MPMYMTSRAPGQQMAALGRNAPQYGNAAGSSGQYSPQRPQTPASGAATTKPVPGLATALGGAQPRPQGYAPAQTGNRSFANWNEPGSDYGGGNTPAAPAGGWSGPPVQGYKMDTGDGMGAMMDRRYASQGWTGSPVQATMMQGKSMATGPMAQELGPASPGSAQQQQPRANTQATASTAYAPQQRLQQVGPQMMGPATSQQNLSMALGNNVNTSPIYYTARRPDGSYYDVPEQQDDSGTSGGTAAGGGSSGPSYNPMTMFGIVADALNPQNVANTATNMAKTQSSQGGFGGPGKTDQKMFQDLGFEAGRAAGAFPSGMARALNEYTKEDIGNYYDNFSDIDPLATQGRALMNPGQQAAADAAERAAMQSGINAQRDEQLRMMMGQRGRGGMVGSGAATGLLNSALRAQALGEQNLAQDQYQRMLGRTQLGGQLVSDYGRQKYGLMNDAYASPGEIAAMLMQGAQGAADIVSKSPFTKSLAELTGIGA